MITLIVLAVLAAAAVFLYHRGARFEWSEFADAIVRVDAAWLTAAAVLGLGTYIGRVLRWQVMLSPLRRDSSFWGIFSATAIGFTAVILFGRPGEVVRPYLISVKEKVPFSSQMAAWLLERIYDLLVVLVIFGFAVAQFKGRGSVLSPALQWVFATGGTVVVAAGVACLAILLFARNFSHQMTERLLAAASFLPASYRKKLDSFLRSFVQGMDSTRSNAAVALMILYTVLEWIVIVACYYCMCRGFDATRHFTVLDTFMVLGFIAFGSLVQIPGIGGGPQVVGIVVLTELYGIEIEPATAVSLIFWIISWFTIVPFGLVLAAREGLNWKKLKHLKEAGEV